MDKPRILIVEDEVIISDNLKGILELKGYEVVDIVITGKDAIDAAEKYHPHIILMDILLKGDMDGVSAAMEIKSRTRIPVIYLTAYSDEETIDKVKKSEPDGFLVKPYRRDDLFDVIDRAIVKYYRQN